MSTVTRRSFTPQKKAEIVRRHLAGKEAVSNLATEFQIQPSQIHAWVKVVLDQAEAAGAGLGYDDDSSVIKVYQKMSGIRLPKPKTAAKKKR